MLRVNTNRKESIRFGDNEIEDITSFTYLGIIVDTFGGTYQCIKDGTGKARATFILLLKI